MQGDDYKTARVCLNGHATDPSLEPVPTVTPTKEFCDTCGALTITICQDCNLRIPGYLRGSMTTIPYSPPSFCKGCGKSFPWTESRLKAAQELADEQENLTPEERETLKNSLDDIVRDTSHATVGATRFKKLVAKAGKEAAEGFKNILVDIVSETIRKTIWMS